MPSHPHLPHRDDVMRAAARRHRPRARQRHRRARHGPGRRGRRRRRGRPSPSPSPPPAARCGRRSSSDVRARVGSLPGVTTVQLDWTEMTAEREGRGHGQGPLERRASAPRTPRSPPTTKVITDRVGQGRRRQVVGHRQPGRRARRPRAHRRRARRRHLGLLGPPHARRRGPARRRDARRRRKLMVPHERPHRRRACCEVVSMGFLVDDEETALMWRGLMLNRGVQHFLEDVAVGRRPRLPAHRHAAGHRRRADGPGQAAAPGRDDRRDDAGAAPRRRSPIRAVEHGPQELPAGGRRHREHERVHVRARRRRTPCSARAAARQLADRRRRPAARPGPARAGGRRPAATPARRSRSATGPRPTRSAPSPSTSSTRPCRRSRWPAARARMLDAAVAALDAQDSEAASGPAETVVSVPSTR